MDNDQRITGYPPIETAEATLLILGSMPSVASLERSQYYGHPRNHFWPLIFRVLGEALPEVYEARAERLRRRGVAVWDSVYSCVRPGSLDKDIRQEQPNDIPAFLRDHPAVRAVAFNGATSMAMHDKYFARKEGVAYLLLPSTSPVPRRQIKTLEDKAPYWMELRQYITPMEQ